MKRNISNKFMAFLMAGAMAFSSAPATMQAAYAAEVYEEEIIQADEYAEEASVGETDSEESADGEKAEYEDLLEDEVGDADSEELFALMNIPYGEFYAAEGDGAVDAVSSATKSKPRAINLAGGSYHVSETGEDITGIIYPVRFSKDSIADLEAMIENGGITLVTDEDSKSYTIRLRGQETTVTLSGEQVLFESPSYSLYILDKEPVSYKDATLTEGKFIFGPAIGEVNTIEGASANQISYFARHADIEIKLDGISVDDGANVSGIVLSDEEGNQYALRHVVNLWRNTEIGFNFDDEKLGALVGKTITNIRYYLSNGSITDYPVEISLNPYLLMNIPYGKFYAAEGDEAVDAVSSATKSKPRAINLAGGSYHVSEAGDDISGVIYPVKANADVLKALKAMKSDETLSVITDNASKEYTIKLRGQETTVILNGKEVLFESPDYSFYVHGEEPVSYKEMTVDESGEFAFDKATGEVGTAEGLTGKVNLNARHADVEITLAGVEVPAAAEGEDPIYVSGVVVTDENGSRYALRHVAELWRSTQIGWNYDDARLGGLTGTTITNIRYYLSNGTITDYPCEITYKIAKYNESASEPAIVQADDQTAAQFSTYLSAIETVTVNGKEYNNKETPVIVTSDVRDESGNVTVPAGTIDLNAEIDGKKVFDGEEYELTIKAAAHGEYTFKLAVPTITRGGDQEIGSDMLEKEQIGLSTDGNPKYLRKVKVDGKILTADSDYEVMGPDESLSILFTKDFQKTLKIGEHKVEVVYANGSDDTVLAVSAVHVAGVKLNKTSAKLLAGKTLLLKVTVSPDNATDRAVTWKSSNSAVATVDGNGKVIAKKTGSTKITVKSNDGKRTAVCTVTVYERVPLYRFYNRKTGDHMYTISEAERKNLTGAGWKAEGIACHVPKKSSKPVYRLYNKSNGDHMFTTAANERKAMISAGWIDEGIGFYSDSDKTVPMYRLYNPNAKSGYHFFTGSKKEREGLIKSGWRDEKIGFYGN